MSASRAEFERLRRERSLLFKRARRLLMQRNRAIGMLEDIRDGVCYTARDLDRAIVAAGGKAAPEHADNFATPTGFGRDDTQ